VCLCSLKVCMCKKKSCWCVHTQFFGIGYVSRFGILKIGLYNFHLFSLKGKTFVLFVLALLQVKQFKKKSKIFLAKLCFMMPNVYIKLWLLSFYISLFECTQLFKSRAPKPVVQVPLLVWDSAPGGN
jgi:hypothetical protein